MLSVLSPALGEPVQKTTKKAQSFHDETSRECRAAEVVDGLEEARNEVIARTSGAPSYQIGCNLATSQIAASFPVLYGGFGERIEMLAMLRKAVRRNELSHQNCRYQQ